MQGEDHERSISGPTQKKYIMLSDQLITKTIVASFRGPTIVYYQQMYATNQALIQIKMVIRKKHYRYL